jgi:hypothetical protein
LARIGYLARGVVYATIGVLAVQTALGVGGAATGTKGAVEELASVPFGEALLWLIAVGFAGLTFWRAIQFFAEPVTRDAKGWGKRAGHAGSAVLYAALSAATVRLLLKDGGGGGDEQASSWTARLMEFPLGRALVAVVGCALIGYGVYQVVEAVRSKFTRNLQLEGLAAQRADWVIRVSKFGIIARGVVFGLMGLFVLLAAVHFNPNEAKGFGETLSVLASQPHGSVLLGVVALGLVAFGVYEGIEARYRRFDRAS